MTRRKDGGRALPAHGEDKPAARAWWQWLLIYPGLALGLIGSVPTLVQALDGLRFDVPFGAVQRARESHAMFERNLDCLDAIAEPAHIVRLADNTAIQAVACRTGDIMIRIDRPDGRSMIRWLEGRSLVAAQLPDAAPGGMGRAQAASAAASEGAPVGVLCTFRQRDGKIVRRVRLATGSCLDEIINPYTGAIVERRNAACAC